MSNAGSFTKESDNGYKSTVTRYKAVNCKGCNMRSGCHKAKGERIIEINHKLNRYRAIAREKLLSEEGSKHRGRRCIETEAVFAQIKWNNEFNRFKLRSLDKVLIDFTLAAIAHNLKK